jgi:hypothetical protein
MALIVDCIFWATDKPAASSAAVLILKPEDNL